MPQLERGGKWVYGWVIVGPEGRLAIPLDAWEEYGFQVGDEVAYLAGSRRSGGFSVSPLHLFANLPEQIQRRVLAHGRAQDPAQVVIPAAVGIGTGARLLVVRGSGWALGFLARGPIYETAVGHPELARFEVEGL